MMSALLLALLSVILFSIVILFLQLPAATRWEIGITNKITNEIKCARLLVSLILLVAVVPFPASANDLSATFDAANRLYEQGKFAEAAATYEKLARSSSASPTLYFNLGNAWFKAGQLGRAIAAWRLAERLEPRDPSLRFNLAFARKKVTGSEVPAGSLWHRAITALTVNEWTGLASAGLWVWFLLLALREWRPAWRRALSGYTATVGIAAALLVGCLAAAANQQFRVTAAVVAVPEAIVRIGPLEEAQPTRFQYRDGNELTVLDQKEIAVGGQSQLWLYVRDAAGRAGWLKSDQIVLLPAGGAAKASNQ
jgi:tetratricopeptide (TPR) repeat protein